MSGDSSTKSIAVVGAGVIGCALAFKLASEGYAVTIFDPGQPGELGPSRGNAGHIAASDISPISGPDIAISGLKMLLDQEAPLKIALSHAATLAPWLFRFVSAGRGAAFERASKSVTSISTDAVDLTEKLYADAGISSLLRRTPALYLYDDEQSLAASRSEWQAKAELGRRSEELSKAELRAIEPALSERFEAAVMTHDWAQVTEPVDVVKGLFDAAIRKGATFSQAKIEKLAGATEGIVLSTSTSQEIFGEVVIAAGAWSRGLAAQVGDFLPVEAETGYNITYPDPGITVDHPIVFAGHGIVSTSLKSGLRVGGWAIFGGLLSPERQKYFRVIERKARKFFPRLSVDGGEKWYGRRPSMPDSVPVISRSARDRRIVYVTGHGHYGLSWAAKTADIALDLIRGNAPSSTQFSIQRFERGRRKTST
ncbi:FAD-binding oxidoreductase [Pararhizobium sp. YC-54]|uniref:NAD(P)/FAD-dependent oxidoreductase n=1 Tax=Pararhizobium sp. YC-54 TaxID=2986920 RepID=UPI0021F7F53D|nr:FAD-binding oxidoreductase [Pararhizobium sp. YC-54]MCW0001500.1 FAD-binding oxidoreductase [Pararhizobium sp. YC-54]